MPGGLLVVGEQGFLGRNVLHHFREKGCGALGTSHRPGAALTIDLASEVTFDRIPWPKGLSHALICAGIASIDRCFKEPEATRSFNVTRTCELIAALQDRGIQVIYCSSDLVFRGDGGGYSESAVTDPACEYGRQKQAVELFLADRGKPYALLRMSKLYSLAPQPGSAVHALLAELQRGVAVRAASDQVIVPTLVEDVAQTVATIVQRGLSGVFHITPHERFSRFSLAVALRDAAGLGTEIISCSIDDFAFAEPRAKHCWLVGERTEAMTKLVPRVLPAVIGTLLTQAKTVDFTTNRGGQ